jgi:hypothetical protein
MKLFLSILVVIGFQISAFGQISQRVHQTITASSINTLNLELNSADVEVLRTRGSRMIVETLVTLDKIDKPSVLKYLVEAGRYNLVATVDASTQTMLVKPRIKKNTLVIKGKECKEHYSYRILVPEGISFVQNNSATASN